MVDHESPLLLVQADWNVSVEQSDSNFWISVQEPKNARLTASVSISRDKKRPLIVNDDRFVVEQLSERKLKVEFKPAGAQATFIAPHRSFDLECGKALDVNEQKVGVSSDRSHNLRVWDADSGIVKATLEGHKMDVNCARFFPSGLLLLSGGADFCLKLWSIETQRCHRTFMGHHRTISGIGFVDRGQQVISCSEDGSLRFWDCATSVCLCCPLQVDDELTCLTTRDFDTLVGSSQGAVHRTDIRTKDASAVINVSSPLNACEWIDENQFAIGGDKLLALYDIRHAAAPAWKTEPTWAVIGLKRWKGGIWVCLSDGRVHFIESNHSDLQLTGSDCDSVYAVVTDLDEVFTSCRDGFVRVYSAIS